MHWAWVVLAMTVAVHSVLNGTTAYHMAANAVFILFYFLSRIAASLDKLVKEKG